MIKRDVDNKKQGSTERHKGKEVKQEGRDKPGSKLTAEERINRKSPETGDGKFDVSDRLFSPIDERHKSEEEELKKQAREFFNKPTIDERTAAEKKEVGEFFKKKDEALGELFSDNIPKKLDQLKKPIDTSFFTRMTIVFTEFWNKIDFYFILHLFKAIDKIDSIQHIPNDIFSFDSPKIKTVIEQVESSKP